MTARTLTMVRLGCLAMACALATATPAQEGTAAASPPIAEAPGTPAEVVLAEIAPLATPRLTAPTAVEAADTANDAGNSITVNWTAPTESGPGLGYVIERRIASQDLWLTAGEVVDGSTSTFVDTPLTAGRPLLSNGVPYEYRVVAKIGETRAASEAVVAVAQPSYFNVRRGYILGFMVAFVLAILALIRVARSGKALYIRPIAGLKALEEAVGRATEMGKPVFFMPGIDEANNIQTLYGMVILQHVTRLVARYETPLIVAVGKAFVVPLAEETVKQGYHDAGRPELYHPGIVRYFSDEQFATVTAVAGIFLREKPATNLYFGSFFAESLILAETGFLTKSIQIAGTGNIHQLPFFVVACDYTLIGEEFFAVSAYLSKDPKLLGGLKAMDLAKAGILLLLVVGCAVATVSADWGAWMRQLFSVS